MQRATFFSAYYRPLHLIYLTIQYWLFGTNAYPYFLINVFFHAINTVILFNISETKIKTFYVTARSGSPEGIIYKRCWRYLQKGPCGNSAQKDAKLANASSQNPTAEESELLRFRSLP